MRPHPRIRKTVKWGGAAVTVLLVVVWVGSGWRSVYWFSSGGNYALASGGGIALGGMPAPDVMAPLGLSWRPRHERMYWWFSAHTTPGRWGLFIPLYLPLAITFAITAVAWHRDIAARRRARVGLCPKCNYDRAGIGAGAVCPECGERPTVV